MRRLLCCILGTGLLSLSPSSTWADETAKAIIAKAIQAHGGGEKVAKLRVRQEKSKSTLETEGQMLRSTYAVLIALPDRWKTTAESELQGNKSTYVTVINGDVGWSNDGRATTGLRRDTVQELLHREHVFALTPLLKDPAFLLSGLPEVRVHDRPALGVKVSAQGRSDIELYFDKETALLTKSRTGLSLRTQDIYWETFYSDYQETDGVKWPRRRVTFRDGKKSTEQEITELKFLDRIDESAFAKPSD